VAQEILIDMRADSIRRRDRCISWFFNLLDRLPHRGEWKDSHCYVMKVKIDGKVSQVTFTVEKPKNVKLVVRYKAVDSNGLVVHSKKFIDFSDTTLEQAQEDLVTYVANRV
jgi:hypothetical protein